MSDRVFGFLLLVLSLVAGESRATFGQVVVERRSAKGPVEVDVSPARRLAQPVLPQVGAQEIPFVFERNQGQTDPQVKFLSRHSGYTVFLTERDAVIDLRRSPDPNPKDEPGSNRHLSRAAITMHLVGANESSEVTGLDELSGKVNYFFGNDPAKWQTRISTFGKVQYRNVYPGVDLIYYGSQGKMEFDFVLAPGSDPAAIRLAFDGADDLTLDKNGDLLLETAVGVLRLRRPAMYQAVGGLRQEVPGGFVVGRNRKVRLWVGNYDHAEPLVIDPVLVYSTLVGGSGSDAPRRSSIRGAAIAVDKAGQVYVAGNTESLDFPIVSPYQNAPGGGPEAFVFKLNPEGSGFLYSTYFGGSSLDRGLAVAVDDAGNAYVAGRTQSQNFPTRNALQASLRGIEDAYVAKFAPDGSALVYSTYLGGSDSDDAFGVAVDRALNAYLVGSTSSLDFPVANALQRTYGGVIDGYLAKISADGSRLAYSTYLGGSGPDMVEDVAVDSAGSAYVVGETASSNFPTVRPLRASLSGMTDIFVARLSPDGATLAYSTYIGGTGDEMGSAIAIDGAGNAHVSGTTNSKDFPTVNAAQPASAGGTDCVVFKLNPIGSRLVYSTYVGGSRHGDVSGDDEAYDIAVDSAGNAFVTGTITSDDFPLLNSVQSGLTIRDAFVTSLNPEGSLLYSTHLGGTGLDYGFGIAVDTQGDVYVVGRTDSVDFPLVDPLQMSSRGDSDIFVTKMTEGKAVVTVSAASFAGSRPLAPDSIASAFGEGLASGVEVATSQPLPTSLAGASIRIRDSSDAEYTAPLFFASAGQINYLVPPGISSGTASIEVINSAQTAAAGILQVAPVAPAIFSANVNGQGPAAALAVRVTADGSQSIQSTVVCGAASGSCTSSPIDMGEITDQVTLVLFGTGIRGRSALASVSVEVGGLASKVVYAGPQPEFVGLDQINVLLPRDLVGRGEVDVEVTVQEISANVVSINVR